MKQKLAVCLVALLAPGGELHAQDFGGVSVTPSVGAFVPFGDVGQGGPDDPPASPEFVNLTRGAALGVVVEAPVHPIVGLRATVRYGLGSELVAGYQAGVESCGTDCSVVRYDRSELARGTVLLAGADVAVWPGPPGWRVRPYGVAGLALRRHFYDRDAVPSGRSAVQAEEQGSRWLPHFGIGSELAIRAMTFGLEAGMYGDVELDGWVPHGGRYGEAFLTLGTTWRP